MRYVVMVACEWKTEIGWDYMWNEYTGIKHTDLEKAKREQRKAEFEGFRTYIEEKED